MRHTSLDIANRLLIFELQEFKKYEIELNFEENINAFSSIRQDYLNEGGWESIFKTEVKRYGLDKYLEPKIALKSISFTKKKNDYSSYLEEQEMDELEMDL